MNKRWFVGIAAVVAVCVAMMPIIGGARPVRAENVSLASTSRAAILLDAQTLTPVFEKETHKRLQIASMVKIMTLSVAFDEIQKREIPLDTDVVASERASSMGGSQAFLDANAVYKLDELLKSIAVASANDSCVAVAEYLFGSVEMFVDEMNARAAAMGLSDTHFVNCTGLPEAGQYSCAADVAVMFKDLIKNERFFDYAGVWMYDFVHPSGRITGLTNTNKLIKFYEGCDGGKTGYTSEARSCITVTAKRGDTRLICVSIGAENSKTRNKEVSEMLNYGFSNYKTEYAVRDGEALGDFTVHNGTAKTVSAKISGDCTAFVKKSEKVMFTVQPDIKNLCAPIKAGDIIGSVVILLNGERYAELPVVAVNGCKQKGYLDIVDDFIGNW